MKRKKKKNKFDIMKYWQEEKADVTTEIDNEAKKSIEAHYAFYLKD
jgi:hypothetical protein